jgi:hypothetical protein
VYNLLSIGLSDVTNTGTGNTTIDSRQDNSIYNGKKKTKIGLTRV